MASNVHIILGISPDLFKSKGYTFHEGAADDRPDLGTDAHWFCWAAPGMAEAECGDGCATLEEAYESAGQHFFANADIPLCESDEDDEALDVKLAIPLLQRCEEFISGFEDDEDQEGIPALLADVRKAIGEPAYRHSEVIAIESVNLGDPVPTQAETLTPLKDRLCAELEEFCEAHSLQPGSADELRAALIERHDWETSPVRKDQYLWLTDYCARWDAAVEAGLI